MKKEENEKLKIKIQIIEAAVASILTVAIIAMASTFAWFKLTDNYETMTKVKEPTNLDIRAGNRHQIINFDLNGIDIEAMAEENGKPEYRVFCVSAGDYKIAYRLQLAYTTNIPFKYTLYSAEWIEDATEQNSDNSYVEYHPLDNKNAISYYELKEQITLTPLNFDDGSLAGRKIGKYGDTWYDKTYDVEGDAPEIYAVPVYLQTDPINPAEKGENKHDFYVLKIEWDADSANRGFTNWNKAQNNKETDIICITATRVTH